MGKATSKYIINAIGKGGETYLTHCQNKQEVTKWITDHQEKLIMNELKIVKKKHPLFNLFYPKK
ncbi:hypothetical protein [Robertmurraya sp.]|jgi:hypothetical protein|uniref:hypothetical protein n=1 Tax=Robertmurraya sp. TaxID=2837525 RepID=UPI0037048E0F